ncbi:MAG: Asp-tRNA(Asn)/Glu-tRNA(Gln) amidotransferase subunit GatC [Patescibacteria group bacterium]|jgi:aspartyl-tRNA(Asn)/glutamyl-tRNA(Gln) amidotransferase subunit C
MALSHDEVIRISHLARISLTETEVKQFQVELSRILDYVDQLNQLDTTGVVPTASVTGLSNRLRPDDITDEFTRDQMLASAIETAEGHIKVKSIHVKTTA